MIKMLLPEIADEWRDSFRRDEARVRAAGYGRADINGPLAGYADAYAVLDITKSDRAQCFACGAKLPKGIEALRIVTSKHGGWDWQRRWMHVESC